MVEIDHGFTTEMKYAIAGTFTGGLSSKGYRLMKQGTDDSWYNIAAVYPVCPDKSEVEGDTAYSSLNELPETVDVIIVVHKKEKTTEIVEEASALKPKNINECTSVLCRLENAMPCSAATLASDN